MPAYRMLPRQSERSGTARTGAADGAGGDWFSRRQDGSVRIYQHSNLLYWWPIWVYGFVCAALTYVQGIGVRELAAQPRTRSVLFHPSPWLGISFIGAHSVRCRLHQRAARAASIRSC